MSVPRSRKEKRTWAEETARVMAIARAIDEELRATVRPEGIIVGPDTTFITPGWDILAVADRIAARTED